MKAWAIFIDPVVEIVIKCKHNKKNIAGCRRGVGREREVKL